MTDAEIIKALGGYKAVADKLGVPANTVWHWTTRGIPYRRRLDFLNAANDIIPNDESFMRGEGRK